MISGSDRKIEEEGPYCYFTEADVVDAGLKVAKYGWTNGKGNRERTGDMPRLLCVPHAVASLLVTAAS